MPPWWTVLVALMAMFYSMSAAGAFATDRGTNLWTAARTYDTYETADGEYFPGSIEPQFYALLMEKAGLDPDYFQPQMDRGRWGELKAKLTEVFQQNHSRCEIMEGSDVCFAPVLNLIDAAEHPHNKARDSYQTVAGMLQQSPAPRFSRTPAAAITAPRVPGEDTAAVLADFGMSAEEISSLTEQGVVAG